jgi:uncharacterized protein YndB with AHSA1/START domain
VKVAPIAPYLEPLRKTLTVERPVAAVFEVFTARINRWWPLRTHSVSESRAVDCGIEPRVGGEVYEVRDDGERYVWGTVLVWDPPHRLVLSWYPGREPGTAQEVELRFSPRGAHTLVELEHRGWATLGPAAADVRRGYDKGWDEVFAGAFASMFAKDTAS